ncbi:MAG: transcription antitermination factor NusB [Hyphomonas sp.]|uniref:RsmB/NOP family class I SAM-dependent RNA methyltransferase n=1 Tax=Hyphomonas sp. TaxID=87 RepID=UPI003527F749
MSGATVRRAAADLLVLTLEKRRTLDEALTLSDPFNTLEGADRGFARAIASAALRELGRIDLALEPLLTRPIEAVSPAVRALLRVGAVQLWRLGTPEHAAVSETVESAKDWPEARSGGKFLNAVLRRAAREPADLDALPATAIWPDWLQAAMEESLGPERAERAARAQLREPALDLTAKSDPAAVARLTGGTVTASGSVRLGTGTVEALPGYDTGDWWVQDEAAALPVKVLLAGAEGQFKSTQSTPEVTLRALDLCAAPGGKTLQLAAAGLAVTALDRSKPRLKRLEENLARTGLSAEIIADDAETWRPAEPADLVLLDAPCSALGTLRRHPEGAWTKRETDVARFPDVQYRLLKAAHGMVRPGGMLVYCVCTPLRSESADVVNRVIADGLYRRVPVTAAETPGFNHSLTAEGDLVTVPEDGAEHDVFFISRLTPM